MILMNLALRAWPLLSACLIILSVPATAVAQSGAPPGSFRASQDLTGLMAPYNEPGAVFRIEPPKAPPGSFRASQDIVTTGAHLGRVGEKGQLYIHRQIETRDTIGNSDVHSRDGAMKMKLKIPF